MCQKPVTAFTLFAETLRGACIPRVEKYGPTLVSVLLSCVREDTRAVSLEIVASL